MLRLHSNPHEFYPGEYSKQCLNFSRSALSKMKSLGNWEGSEEVQKLSMFFGVIV